MKWPEDFLASKVTKDVPFNNLIKEKKTQAQKVPIATHMHIIVFGFCVGHVDWEFVVFVV